ncbi:hypothetical protein V6N13_014408 [Hibiscus sabdariffa]|uniref:Uncharacterized protein n=1 Tax=Hibiscus sabdariffa TaxID=183260 RepID=A0ABR2RV73_9ROSI
MTSSIHIKHIDEQIPNSSFPISHHLNNLPHFTQVCDFVTQQQKMEFQNPISKSNSSLDPHEDYDSTCSSPYVSAPSSPGRAPGPGPGSITGYGGGGFYYSAPASPMHFAITSVASKVSSTQPSSPDNNNSVALGFEFEFSARYGSSSGSGQTGSMSSADELFLNGKIRPMKLPTHLERPLALSPLTDLEHGEEEEEEEEDVPMRLRDKSSSVRRRTRSMSPSRNNPTFGLTIDDRTQGSDKTADTDMSAASSRSSSTGRSSKRWVFLKDFLRSKSEGTGRSNNSKFWSTISFSPPTKEKKPAGNKESRDNQRSKNINNKPVNGILKRRVPPSPHELHYTANRAQAESMRKKTFLPYRQGLLGCLGFSSKGYGAMNGFCRALNPVSSSAEKSTRRTVYLAMIEAIISHTWLSSWLALGFKKVNSKQQQHMRMTHHSK